MKHKNNNRLLKWSVGVLMATLLALLTLSCMHDDIAPRTPTLDEDEVMVTLSFRLPANASATRALSSEGEDAVINTVEVLVFESSEDEEQESTYSYTAYATTIAKDAEKAGNFYLAEVKLVKSVNGKTYDLVVLSNSQEVVGGLSVTSGEVKSSVLAKLTTSVEGKWIADTSSDQYKYMPMSSDPALLTNQTISAGMSLSNINLYRALARVNVELNLDEGVNNFQLTSVSIYNRNMQGNLIGGYDDENLYTKAPNASSSIEAVPLVYDGDEIAADGKSCTNEIFLFEVSQAGISDDDDRPCIIVVGGLYNSSSTPSYYRIDFYKNEAYLDILRNHSYNFKITEINGPGYSSPELALLYEPENIDSEVECDDDDITEMAFDEKYILGVSQSLFEFDCIEQDNALIVMTDYPGGLILQSLTYLDDQEDWLTLKVGETVLSEGDDIISSKEQSWQADRQYKETVQLTVGTNFGDERTATFTVQAGRLKYVVRVTQEAFQGEVLPQANSYIIAPDNSNNIYIPISQAYRAITSAPAGAALPGNWFDDDDDDDAEFVSELVWQDGTLGIDHSVVGTGSKAYLRIKLKQTNQSGNVVLGIRKADASGSPIGGFLWSWHIWVTDYVPAPSVALGPTFMDRNLGALNNGYLNGVVGGSLSTNAQTAGLLYQWGRKDPFPGTANYKSNGTSGSEATIYSGVSDYLDNNKLKIVDVALIDASSTYNLSNSQLSLDAHNLENLGYAVANPHIFYHRTATGNPPRDWYPLSPGTTQNDLLWGGEEEYQENSLPKTVYDPCPYGWRVPTLKHWTDGVEGATNSFSIPSGGWKWDKDNKGCNVDEKGDKASAGIAGFFPAAGIRAVNANGNGALTNVGAFGFFWSASPVDGDNESGKHGRRFNYNSNGSVVNPAGNNTTSHRASGISVRCVKDESYEKGY